MGKCREIPETEWEMRDIVDFLFRKPRNCLIMSLLEDQGSLENAVNVSYEEHELQDTVDAFRKTKMYDPSGKNRFVFVLRIRESSRNRVKNHEHVTRSRTFQKCQVISGDKNIEMQYIV